MTNKGNSKLPARNPNGILSQSPGLRGTSYPGDLVRNEIQPQRGCGKSLQIYAPPKKGRGSVLHNEQRGDFCATQTLRAQLRSTGKLEASSVWAMPEAKISRIAHRFGFALLLASAALWIVTSVFFVGVWDRVAAITTFPQWMWATAGILSAAIAWRLLRPHPRLPVLLILLWLLTTIYFSDNLLPVVRGLGGVTPPSAAPAGSIRVVSLNCATSAAAAQEVMRFGPDIILLQESPTSNQVTQLAQQWFGSNSSFVVGWDCAIVSRYPLTVLDKSQGVHYTRALVMLPHNREVLVTSLRLTPPLGAMDLWKPATWRAYTEDRRLRTRQLRTVLEAERPKPKLPEIVGGDFNAPAGDGIYRLLHEYRDSHRRAGRGWGGTALNTIPIFRPDQIWLKHLTAASCYAVRTEHSDHRMVVADVLWDAN